MTFFQILRRDAAALIDDLDEGFVLALPDLDRDASAGGRILDGIVQNVDEHLPQAVGVGVDRDHLLRLRIGQQKALPLDARFTEKDSIRQLGHKVQGGRHSIFRRPFCRRLKSSSSSTMLYRRAVSLLMISNPLR